EDLLVFEGITFQEITRIMERRYDVEIIVDNSEVKNLKYTGSFKNIDDIDKALKIMKETTDIAYEKQGRIIKIRKGINFKSQSL
ncbi:MAG: DUF4974 domain-containing protein, partial [Daejeonella sp.]|nr:DUF4974 domain-containing protein [Daejeonella sp.]